MSPGQVFIAPVGTPPPMHVVTTDRSNPWLHVGYAESYSFPQRFMLGLDQETHLAPYVTPTARIDYTNAGGRTIRLSGNGIHPMINSRPGAGVANDAILPSRDVPNFAHELFERSRDLPKAKLSLPGGGEPYIFVGEGESQARVYTPKNAEQAQRNLNFAIANLKAYHQWETVTEPMLKREAEAEARAKAEKERIEAEQAAFYKAGLDLFNKVHGTRFTTWEPACLSLSTRTDWAEKAKEISALKRKSDPFRITVTSADIAAGTISAAKLNQRLFGDNFFRL